MLDCYCCVWNLRLFNTFKDIWGAFSHSNRNVLGKHPRQCAFFIFIFFIYLFFFFSQATFSGPKLPGSDLGQLYFG